ncbi:hypothetical protein [Snodgrassella sp. ESL0304]|uniref:hypothetical protein n=1 Tax=Snodgrassella sp. ESL0304 TaxID=2705032 RepID=UPI001EEC228E|nr:hypothetical protein [Snodgrassella sp. ESL0304]
MLLPTAAPVAAPASPMIDETVAFSSAVKSFDSLPYSHFDTTGARASVPATIHPILFV